MLDSNRIQRCSACSACVAVCPKKCISMVSDGRGFLYPYIEKDKCIDCNLCNSVCEKAARQIESKPIKGYGVYSIDERLRFDSSSGGFFSTLAEKIIDDGGVVIGAAFAEDFRSVHHIVVEKKEDLRLCRGSKYIQSDAGGIFSVVKKKLLEEMLVLFSGTPCQVAGLRAFLKKDYNNLICVDFVCHGVPSSGVWRKYCDEKEMALNAKIVHINFRHKKYGWNAFGMSIGSDEKISYLSKDEDPFLRIFLKDYILRSSCYECMHKGISRKSDITMAYLWGIAKIAPEYADGKGTSLLLVHSERGMEYLKRISQYLVMFDVDVKMAVSMNRACIKSAEKPKNYEEFWKDYEAKSIEELAGKYDKIPFKKKLKLTIKKSPLYRILRGGYDYYLLFVLKEQ